MINSLYWNVYRNLEKELLNLAEYIHIDDRQLDIYSMKIADLIIRCAVETEAISKELYFREGGTEPNNNDLYYDTICLAYLNDKWQLDKKVVMISSPEVYLEEEDNLVLKPLYKANKRGTSSSKWQRAYQALKHNRSESLKKHATLRNLISALAALYILNLYYKDNVYELNGSSNVEVLDAGFGSILFSVKIHPWTGLRKDGIYLKKEHFDSCIYLIEVTEKTKAPAINAMATFEKETCYAVNKRGMVIPYVSENENIPIGVIPQGMTKAQMLNKSRKAAQKMFEQLKKLRYEAVLNKQQY